MASAPPLLYFLIFAVAALYATVGHGGASGYLAVLSLFGRAPAEMRTSALLLNLLVAAISFTSFSRAGHFRWRLFWPFAAGSIPLAFVGGMIRLPVRIYSLLLAAALLLAAWRLMMRDKTPSGARAAVSLPTALLTGGGVGLLSGLVGVGGGIFLSPLMILFGWADAKETAAVSAAFIWVNSAAGLLGGLKNPGTDLSSAGALALTACAGGLAGSYVGARKLSVLALRRLLGAVLLIAAYKLIRISLL